MDAPTTDKDPKAASDEQDRDQRTDGDVRYVLSGQPTGWAAMAAKVREFDEEKIKDTKEDVDTLLVFVRYQSLSLLLHCLLIPSRPASSLRFSPPFSLSRTSDCSRQTPECKH